jgi:hypothetical protein
MYYSFRAQRDDASVRQARSYSGLRPKLVAGARKVLSTAARRYRLGPVTSGDCDRDQLRVSYEIYALSRT